MTFYNPTSYEKTLMGNRFNPYGDAGEAEPQALEHSK